MRHVISRLLLPHQGGTTTATLVALVSVNLVNLVTTANHAIGNNEISENPRLLGSSESRLHLESTVNLQQLESIANHLKSENHLHLGW